MIMLTVKNEEMRIILHCGRGVCLRMRAGEDMIEQV